MFKMLFLSKSKLRKIIFLLLSISILLFFSYQIKNFKLDASSDTLILQNDNDFKFFNYYNDIFKNKNFLVLAVQSDKIIDSSYIKKINEIKTVLSRIDKVNTTFSIVDAPILISNNIKLTDLSSDKIETINNTKINLNLILNEFAESSIFKDQIISTDKQTSSILIYPKINENFLKIRNERDRIINNPSINSKKKLSEINKIYRKEKDKFNKDRHILIEKIRSDLKTISMPYQVFLGGIDMIADDTINFVKNDILIFSITVSIFLILILLFIFKEIKWVGISLITTFYSIIIMIGVTSILNWEITAISSNFVSLMLILSVSMNIHIINQYRIIYNKKNKENILYETIYSMFFPCLYTALTTIVAFGSLIFSDIKPVIDFGKIMILALTIIFLTSFTILPLLISFFPKINIANNKNILHILYFFQKSFNFKNRIIIINIVIFIISILGITNLSVENSFINYFKKNTEIYKGMKVIDNKLGGTTPLDIIITFKDERKYENIIVDNDDSDLDLEIELDEDTFGENNGLTVQWFTDEKLNAIKDIHKYFEEKKEIGKVQSIYSIINVAEKINKNPLDSFQISILYSQIPENYKNDLILPYLSIEKNMAKINARVKDSEQIKRNELIKSINNDLYEKYDIIEEIKINGLLVLYNNMLQSLFSSQIKSFGIVLILIFIMFIILFKSIKLSVIGIIPNIFASSFILGLIGILKIPLDIMTITIAAITIGIAVDNTIHYLYRVRKNLYLVNKLEDSIVKSHNSVGVAVLTTSVTIAFGFTILSLSNFIPTILFGIFTSIAMIVAMLGVLITIPSLIQLLYNKNESIIK